MANILDGIKVVEVASFIACPAAAMMLGDFGAEVVKIELPPEGFDEVEEYLSVNGLRAFTYGSSSSRVGDFSTF